MKPATRIRAARILIPVAVAIGALAAVAGAWWTIVAMVFLIVSQVVNLHAAQRKLNDRPPNSGLR